MDEPLHRDQQRVQPGQNFPEIVTTSPESFHPQMGMHQFPGSPIQPRR
jgi:hypothetical protein